MSTETPNAPTDPSTDPSTASESEAPKVDGAAEAPAPAAAEPSTLEQAFTQLQGDFDTPSLRLRLHGTQSDDPSDLHAVVLNERGEPLASSGARVMLRPKARARGLRVTAEQGGGVLRVRIGDWPTEDGEEQQVVEVVPAETTAKPAPKSNRRGS